MTASDAPPPQAAANNKINNGGAQATTSIRFEELTIDDSLSLMERIEMYCKSHISLQRLVHVKKFTEALSETNDMKERYDRASTLLLKLVPILESDVEEVVRVNLCSQLVECVPLLISTTSNDTTTLLIQDSIIPCLGRLLVTEEALEVRRGASEALAGIACHLSAAKMEDIVLKHCLPHAMQLLDLSINQHDNQVIGEDKCAFGVVLLGEFCQSVNGASVRQDMAPHLISLVQNTTTPKSSSHQSWYKVRSACAIAIPRAFCRVVNQNFFQNSDHDPEEETEIYNTSLNLLEAYTKLIKDSAAVPVRKICSEHLEDFKIDKCSILRPQQISLFKSRLIDCTMALLKDKEAVVRNSTLQRLGPIIATILSTPVAINDRIEKDDRINYAQVDQKIVERVRRELLPEFFSMSVNNLSNKSSREAIQASAELRMHCAYNLPGVLYSLGKNAWKEDRLKECYYNLLYDNQWLIGNPTSEEEDSENDMLTKLTQIPMTKLVAVRRTFASSISDVAHILDTRDVESDLLPIYNFFMTSSLEIDAVKMVCLRQYCRFVNFLTESNRLEQLSLLPDIYRACAPTTNKTNSDGGAVASTMHTSSGNWRMREIFAKQMNQIYHEKLYNGGEKAFLTDRIILSLPFLLLEDPVADVRRSTASELLPTLIDRLYKDMSHYYTSMSQQHKVNDCNSSSDANNNMVLQQIKDRALVIEKCFTHLNLFAKSDSFCQRQSFCWVTYFLLKKFTKMRSCYSSRIGTSFSVSLDKMILVLLNIANDDVVNVRSCLKNILVEICKEYPVEDGDSKSVENVFPSMERRKALFQALNRIFEEDENWWN